MRVDLVELVRTRQIRHPSRLVRLQSACDGDFCIEVAGYPWWLEKPQPASDERITFHFEGISDGVLDCDDVIRGGGFDEDLQILDVRPLSEHPWANGVHCDVYCNEPLPDASNIHANLCDFLLSVDCPYGPTRYLNGRSLEEFVEIASSRSFLLCHGPESVCRIVTGPLEDRGVKLTVIMGKDLSSGLICVRIGDSYWICESAYAVFNRGVRDS